MPAVGAHDRGFRAIVLERRDLRVDGRHARLRRVDLLGPRAGLQPRDASRLAARARSSAACRRASASSRRGDGVVALLLRAGAVAQELLEPRFVVARGRQFRLRRVLVGGRRGDLRLGLLNVLGPRAGLQQPQLRLRLRAVGLRARDREIRVGRVESSRAPARPRRGRPR